jgi:hypothetical protein
MAQEMSTATGISIAALLDWASENKRVAKTQTEEQKAKGHIVSCDFSLFVIYYLHLITTQKDENDRLGGKSICNQSMCTMGRHGRSTSDSDSNNENAEPGPPHCKRPKVSGHGSADLKEMKDLMMANEERRGEFEGKIIKQHSGLREDPG